MLKLIRNLFLLGFLAALSMSALALFLPHDTENYMAAAADKHRLLNSVPSPRVILIGGSNTAFSVDGQKVAERFGMPVINMGLNVDLGLRYMLNEVKPFLRDGDILLIFPEYSHFSGVPLDGEARELGTLIKFCPECLSAISTPRQAFNVVVGLAQGTEGDLLHALGKPREISPVYYRHGFDEWGNMVAHLNQPAPSGFASAIPQIQIPSPNRAIELLDAFYRSLEGDVQVFMVYPAVPVGQYKAQKERFSALDALIRSRLEFPVVGVPQDFAYAGRLFYDTSYHLNREGRELHTDHVLDMFPSLP